MLKILKAPQAVLSQKAQSVEKIDKKILAIIKEMKKILNTQDNPKGVGLAAPQIGYPLRIFITKLYPKSPFRIFINPEITWVSEELTNGVPERENPLEGCLSLPGVWGNVRRHLALKLKHATPDGKIHHQNFKGFLATIIQHEIDHLDGRLFPQRVLEQEGKLYKVVGKDEKGKEKWEEIEISI